MQAYPPKPIEEAPAAFDDIRSKLIVEVGYDPGAFHLS
jgi:hypothetical protein